LPVPVSRQGTVDAGLTATRANSERISFIAGEWPTIA
jgi:hypothetical protein